MSLATNVTDLATRVATELKAHKVLINGNAADLTALQTTAKTNLVAAINELKSAQSGAAGINDGTTGSSSTWSSTKINTQITAAINALIASAPGTLDTLDELAAALGDDANFASTVTTALANRVRTDTAAQGLTGTQQTNARTNIAAADAAALATLTTNVGTTTTNFVTTFEAGLV